MLIKIQVLLAVWLWIDYRVVRRTEPRRRRLGTLGLLAAGLLLVALALLIRASGVSPPPPGWEVTRIYP